MPSGQWGRFVVKDGYQYPLTNDDILWAARMVYGEGGSDRPAVLWATAQRFAGIPARRNRHVTYLESLRQWSEPLMERRTSTGSWCLANPTSDRCTPEKMLRRERMQSMPWDPPYPAWMTAANRSKWEAIKVLTVKWARGEVPNSVPLATDMAAESVTPGPRLVIVKRAGGNVFYMDPAVSNGWTPDHVTVQFQGRVAGPGVTGGIKPEHIAMIVGSVGMVVVGGFAFWAWRRSHSR